MINWDQRILSKAKYALAISLKRTLPQLAIGFKYQGSH